MPGLPGLLDRCQPVLVLGAPALNDIEERLLELSRVIRETLFDRKTLIDILTIKPERILAVQEVPIQGRLF